MNLDIVYIIYKYVYIFFIIYIYICFFYFFLFVLCICTFSLQKLPKSVDFESLKCISKFRTMEVYACHMPQQLSDCRFPYVSIP